MKKFRFFHFLISLFSIRISGIHPILTFSCLFFAVITVQFDAAAKKMIDEEIDYDALEKRVNKYTTELDKAENSIEFIKKQYIKYGTETKKVRIQKQIMEAESYYHGGDYKRASIILYELISDPPKSRDASSPTPEISNENSKQYFEAEKIMADALFDDKNYFASRKYYNDLYMRGGLSYAQDALLKLIQIAGITERYDELDEYRSHMKKIPNAQVVPEVRYLFGKTLFKKGDVKAAIYELGNIGQQENFYFQARYLIGAVKLVQNDLKGALVEFENLVKQKPMDDKDTAIHNLTQLAIGRIKYSLGKYDAAQRTYQLIDRASPYFNESLYETGWSLINRNKLDAAIKMLDLYILSLEDDLKLPHAKIVQAKLWLRNGDFERATEEMEYIITEYQAAKDEIERIVSLYKDPEVYYYQITGKTPPEDSAALSGESLPDNAVKWAAKEKKVKKALIISDDLDANKNNLDTIEAFSKRIVKTLSSRNVVDMFDTFKEAKTRSLAVESELLMAERHMSDLATDIISLSMSKSDKSNLDSSRMMRKNIQDKIDAMPKSEKQYLSRLENISKQINNLDEVLTLLNSYLKGYLKQLTAVEKTLANKRHEMVRDPVTERNFLARISDEKNVLINYKSRVAGIRSLLQNMKDELGLGETSATDSKIRKQYIDAIAEERKLIDKFRDRLTPKARKIIEKIDADVIRVAKARKELNVFDENLAAMVAKKGGTLKEDILKQSDRLLKYSAVLATLQKETEEVAGGIAMSSLGTVKDKFYNILLEANVGLIDVAWKKKEVKTDAINKLVQVKNRELRALEREFKEVRELITK